jgi:hypothetical protein
MLEKRRLLAAVPALCGVSITLLLTVLRPVESSDLSVGVSVGVLLGISLLSVISLMRKTS